MTAVIQSAFLKTSKLVNFYIAVLILKTEENTQHFWHIFKKGKNTIETQKRICAVYGEGAITDSIR